MTFEQRSSSLVLHQMMSDHNSSDLAPQRQMMSDHNSSDLAPQRQMMSDHNSSDLAPQRQMVSAENNTSGPHESSSSKLVPKVVPPADKKATSRQEL
ncbi:hypothetical protein Tco_1363831, partial [Tanacetum coccineum]